MAPEYESGRKDYRLILAALAAWGACLLPPAQQWPELWPRVSRFFLIAAATLLILGVCMAAAFWGFGYSWVARFHGRTRVSLHFWGGQFAVALVVATCVLLSANMLLYRQSHDAAAVTSEATASVLFSVKSPAVASTMRGSDCQYQVQAQSVLKESVESVSQQRVLVFASGKGCDVTESAEYSAEGILAPAKFGQVPVWFTLPQDSSVPLRKVGEANLLHRAIAVLRTAFLKVCTGLSVQGRILVPGVTMGILGSDAAPTAVQGEDTAAGTVIKEDFKNSGIVHLLAVSGGHFVLIAEFLRRAAGRCHLPRLPTAGVVIVGYSLLAVVMYPSDSVLRALVMGILAALASVVKRPSQAMSCLCWTVILCLLFQPSLARSFGFALSCAAVAGIVLFNPVVTRLLPRRLPSWMSEAVAVTVSAQIFTLPIQLLMNASVPLWSVVANVCVAPFVTWSTLCGLASLLVSWICPGAGWVLAWAASGGTGVMNTVAHACSQLGGGVVQMPMTGVGAAAVAMGVEMVVALLAMGVHKLMERWR
jgi:competence protein ComEC